MGVLLAIILLGFRIFSSSALGQEGGITLGELQRSARNVLNLILNLKRGHEKS